jgi:hypothetical protein
LRVRKSFAPGKLCRSDGAISGGDRDLCPPLPQNWTGKKQRDVCRGENGKGKWLLFTDADTFHKPGSLARALAEAERESAALLSYSPEQEVQTFSEKAVMPVIFAELAARYPPAKVRDPNRRSRRQTGNT